MRRRQGPPRALLAAALMAVIVIGGCASATPTQGLPAPSAQAPGVPSPAPTTTGTPAAPTNGPTAASTDGPTAEPNLAPSPSPGGRLPGEPDPLLTPGATNPAVTQATIATTICVSGWTATVRPPASYTTALKKRQLAAYGYADTTLADYEEDHLISLEIGGAPRDPLNLWPEPYGVSLSDGTAVGAREKDQLENYLHRQVCRGQMRLAAAQALIAAHWESAWRAAGLDTGRFATPSPSATF